MSSGLHLRPLGTPSVARIRQGLRPASEAALGVGPRGACLSVCLSLLLSCSSPTAVAVRSGPRMNPQASSRPSVLPPPCGTQVLITSSPSSSTVAEADAGDTAGRVPSNSSGVETDSGVRRTPLGYGFLRPAENLSWHVGFPSRHPVCLKLCISRTPRDLSRCGRCEL